MNTRYVPSLALLLLLLGAGPLWAARSVDESHPISADGLLQVDNLAGLIEVAAGEEDQVRIKGQLGERVERLEVTTTSSGLRIRVHNPENSRRIDSTTLRISVPATLSLELDSVSADMVVTGLQSRQVSADTVSGDIEIRASAEQFRVETVSGDITIEGESDRTELETVSGEIQASGMLGEVRLSTVSGDVTLQAGELSLGRFETVSGDLELRLAVTEGGRLNAESMSGDVLLELPAAQQGEFSAETYSGDIRSQWGSPEDGGGSGQVLRHRAGEGSAGIRIESFSGDIRIRQS